jgi:hypothetical protein
MPRRCSLASLASIAFRASISASGAAAGAAAVLAAGGCFYLEDINHRPAIEIVRVTETAIERGAMVHLRALVYDPDEQDVRVSWRAQACAETTEACDEVPYAESSERELSVSAPLRTAAGLPVQHLRITLAAVDTQGARALPEQRLDLDVVNAVPRLSGPQPVGNRIAVGLPLQLRVRRTDTDDLAEAVQLTWKVYGPAGTSHPPLRQLPSSDPEIDNQELIPDVAGAWLIEVIARDPVGGTAMAQRALVVTGDLPPCLTALSPPSATPLLLDQRRRLSVLIVEDDFDPFPALPGGGARFSWSLLAPSRGAARQPLLGASGSFVELDPAAFVPGELVELRVEVADRIARALPCPDGDAQCSIQENACQQRQTWRLEIR